LTSYLNSGQLLGRGGEGAGGERIGGAEEEDERAEQSEDDDEATTILSLRLDLHPAERSTAKSAEGISLTLQSRELRGLQPEFLGALIGLSDRLMLHQQPG
jgi:hypothetical protein